jgi:hypothetical protein
MGLSPITKVLNHLSDVVVNAAAWGGIGFLANRAIQKIDPRVGFVCGAITGGTLSLLAAKGSNTSSKAVALATLIFVPYHVCKRVELPATFKTAGIITGATAAAILAVSYLLGYGARRSVSVLEDIDG